MLLNPFFFIAQWGHEITLWVLFFMSVLSLAVFLERFFFLRAWKKSTQRSCEEFQQAVDSDNIGWIQSLTNQHYDPSYNPGFHWVSLYIQNKPDLVVPAFQSFVQSTKNKLEARLSVLANVGSTAPFVGLLGTLFGVMHAFNALETATHSENPFVMLGITKALLATAAGLIVAIPAVIFYNYSRRQCKIILQNFKVIESGYHLYVQSFKGQKNKESEESSLPFEN